MKDATGGTVNMPGPCMMCKDALAVTVARSAYHRAPGQALGQRGARSLSSPSSPSGPPSGWRRSPRYGVFAASAGASSSRWSAAH